ncbi:MAG: DUF1902 domain-containing protein [Selenomonadaceae bacterium]|nr:DUF1902 domain-containing protein [Selenomonadaceae bacterium]
MVEEYVVRLDWDEEAEVWIATSDEIKGLVLESDNVDTLVQRTLKAVPELLEINGQEQSRGLHFQYDRHEAVVL